MSYIFGSENFAKTYISGSSFCLFKFIFLGFHLAENLYFWISLGHNKEELNEKILNGHLSMPFCLPYRNVERYKMSNLYCWISFAHDFCQRLYF